MRNTILSNSESPFLNLTSFSGNGTETGSPEHRLSQEFDERESPFLTVFESAEEPSGVDPRQEAFVELMDELFDEEFEEALEDFATHVQDWHETVVVEELDGKFNQETLGRQLLQERYAPLLHEVDRFMSFMEEKAGHYDRQELTVDEWQTAVDNYKPSRNFEAPEIEQFWGKIAGWAKKGISKVAGAVKKGVKWVSKGVKWVKNKALKWVYKKLKGLANKFLKGVIEKYSDKIPKSLQPDVENIKKKYFGEKKELEYQQLELNAVLAELLLAPSEIEAEMFLEQYLSNEQHPTYGAQEELDQAREKFVKQLGELKEGEDPEPIVEEFVQAILTGLKWAVRIIGRNRVKRFLSRIIATILNKIKVIKNKKRSRQVAGAIVGIGLDLLDKAELTPEEMEDMENGALAATVEKTVQTVSQLPDYILKDDLLLEGYIVEAFETAAAANLPDMLSETMYEERPELRETNKHNVFWRMKKLGRRKRKNRFRYKKLTKEIETELTPYMAEEIRTFGGVSLASILRGRLGLRIGGNLPVKVHLYELLPGGQLFHISKNEALPGLGSAARYAWSQLHPLTSVAAGLMLGEPALGCKSSQNCLLHNSGRAGHRYYYLEIPGAAPQIFTQPDGSTILRRATGLKTKLNFITNRIELFLFLGEAKAQATAVQLRRNNPGNGQRRVMNAFTRSLRNAFAYPEDAQMYIVHPQVLPGWQSGAAIWKIPGDLLDTLCEKLIEWSGVQVANYFKNEPQVFIQAAEHDADGVTLAIHMAAPEDFDILRKFIGGQPTKYPLHFLASHPAKIEVQVKPGYHHV